jgi:hypothetical protein
MKKYVLFFIALSIFAVLFTSCAPTAVSVRPAAVVKIRPLAPSPRHVWVTGGYAYRGGRYVYTDGYWATPRNGYSRYVEGHWKYGRRGYVWMPGYWR